MINVVEVAAATGVVGYDLLQNEYHAQLPENRVLTGVGLKGSAAAGDTEVEVFIDNVKVTVIKNTGTGYPNNDDILPLEALGIPGGSTLHAYVTDAPATNPIYLITAIETI